MESLNRSSNTNTRVQAYLWHQRRREHLVIRQGALDEVNSKDQETDDECKREQATSRRPVLLQTLWSEERRRGWEQRQTHHQINRALLLPKLERWVTRSLDCLGHC